MMINELKREQKLNNDFLGKKCKIYIKTQKNLTINEMIVKHP